MKAVFDVFFNKMNESWKRVWNTYPKVTFNEEYVKSGLYISEKSKDGYVEWQPKLQIENLEFENIEKELGFNIHADIKKYVSTYWFLPLDGSLENVEQLQLKEILPNYDIEKMLKERFRKDLFHYLNDSEYFLIGEFCCIEGDDSYSLQVNNNTGEVVAVQPFDKKEIRIATSIEELLLKMRGEWE